MFFYWEHLLDLYRLQKSSVIISSEKTICTRTSHIHIILYHAFSDDKWYEFIISITIYNYLHLFIC